MARVGCSDIIYGLYNNAPFPNVPPSLSIVMLKSKN
jgi:hypothetical protein